MRREIFPFTAIVNQEPMKNALVANAVNPAIGGVLISGHKGTGKSTAVRALARLLPEICVVKGCPFHCDPDDPETMDEYCRKRFARGEKLIEKKIPMPLVELPLNATQDRLAGSLHVEHALKTGQRRFDPGLLALANRGILYVDEVNLLEDHLVDALLDVAASGVNIVEREGISFTHRSRFLLVGTMNPEEGALRPQFLDRFGLFVPIKGVREEIRRGEIVKRCLAFEQNPKAFIKEWASREKELCQKIARARKQLLKVNIPESLVKLSVSLAREAGARGHRAEITMIRLAKTLAALNMKKRVDEEIIIRAARFVLPHRMDHSIFGVPESCEEKLEEILVKIRGKKKLRNRVKPQYDPKITEGYLDEPMQVPGSGAAGSIVFSQEEKAQETLVRADDFPFGADIDIEALDAGVRQPGKYRKKKGYGSIGRYVESKPLENGDSVNDLAVDATLRAAVLRYSKEPLPSSGFSVKSEDLRVKVREHRFNTLIIFVVDSSESMTTGNSMAAAKGAAMAFLTKAYQKRYHVALVTFRNEQAQVLLEPTASVALAGERLSRLPSGGATPFADGLVKASQIVKNERIKDPGIKPVLVLISDGEANVPLSKPGAAMEEMFVIAKKIRREGIACVVIDTNSSPNRSFPMLRLSQILGAFYQHTDHLKPSDLISSIRQIETA